MALSIKHPEADQLARELAAVTGESLTEAVLVALRERLLRQRQKRAAPERRAMLRALRESRGSARRRCAGLSVARRAACRTARPW